jgi:hypothetical protein
VEWSGYQMPFEYGTNMFGFSVVNLLKIEWLKQSGDHSITGHKYDWFSMLTVFD